MKEFYLQNKEDIDKIIFFVVLVAALYVFIRYLSSYFAPLIFGYIVCVILTPLTDLLNRKLRIPRSISSFVSISIMIITVIVLSTSVISTVVDEAKAFLKASPELVDSIADTARNMHDQVNGYMDILPEEMTENADKLFDTLLENFTGILGSGVKTGSIEIVKFLPNTLFVTLLGLICSFFLLNDRRNVEFFIVKQIPRPLRRRFRIARKGVLDAISGYIKAECLIMCIVAVICTIGLTILGSPYALLLGILISFVDALPVFGSGAIFWPWCIYSMVTGDYKTAIGIAVIDIVIIILRQTLEPRILGNQIGLHPVATLMSIFIGLKIFGVLGFIIGPIILVTIKAMQENDLLPAWK